MGAIADALMAYMQPLIEQTDGSLEQMNKALMIGQLCYNLAMSPEGRRDAMLNEIRGPLSMSEEEFDDFRRTIIAPMIRRHEQMFPMLHGSRSPFMRPLEPIDPVTSPSPPQAHTRAASRGEKYPGTDPYAPCPCNSGEKYKFCCRGKGR